MDSQAAINTSHFSSRPYSHFHFDVIIISFPPIVTGLRASIYTHWLQGEKKEQDLKVLLFQTTTDRQSDVFRLKAKVMSRVWSHVYHSFSRSNHFL